MTDNRNIFTRWASAAVLLTLFCLVIFTHRYTSPISGFPSYAWDYGAHVGILNSFLKGQFFSPTGKPMYGGAMGSYFLTAFPVKMGLSLPVSMLVISDLCLVFVFFIFILAIEGHSFSKRILMTFIFIFFVIPLFLQMAVQGYYPLIVSTPFIFGAMFTFSKGREKLAHLLAALGIFCYPMVLIWWGPFFLLHIYENNLHRKQWFLSSAYLITTGILYFWLIRGIDSGGVIELPQFLFVIFMAMYFAFAYQKKSIFEKQSRAILVSFFVLSILSQVTASEISYRVNKLYYWLPYVMIFMVPFVAGAKKMKIVLFCILLVGFLYQERDFLSYPWSVYASGTGGFNDEDENEILDFDKKNCKQIIFLPEQMNTFGGAYLMAANSYKSLFNIDDLRFEWGSGQTFDILLFLDVQVPMLDILTLDSNERGEKLCFYQKKQGRFVEFQDYSKH